MAASRAAIQRLHQYEAVLLGLPDFRPAPAQLTRVCRGLCMRDGRKDGLAMYYAPLEWTNPEAMVTLVGLTPGLTQMWNACTAARECLNAGWGAAGTLCAAQLAGAFSGVLRANLVTLLTGMGVHRRLKIKSCDSLFAADAELVQTTSVVRFPLFLADGANYSVRGAPLPHHPGLYAQSLRELRRVLTRSSQSLVVPLGGPANVAVADLVDRGGIDLHVVRGVLHPSGQNNARRLSGEYAAMLRGWRRQVDAWPV